MTALCAPLGIEHCTESPLALVKTETHLALRKLDEPKLGDVFVDFVAGAMAHRRKFGGGRGEAVAKAVGIKGAELPSVIDATAGLGRDAFVLASIGLPSAFSGASSSGIFTIAGWPQSCLSGCRNRRNDAAKYAIIGHSSYYRTQSTNRECRCGVFRSNVSAQTKICPSQKKCAYSNIWLVQIWMPMSS